MSDDYKTSSIAYVRSALATLGVTATELARRIGVSSSTLTRPLNSEGHVHAISGRTLAKIAQELGESLPDGVLAEAGKEQSTLEYLEVPEYNADFAAGGGRIADDDNVRRYWPVPRFIIVDTLRISPDRATIHEVVGDSMEPTLSSGDYVIIDNGDARIGTPGVFACWDGDGLVIKRVEKVIGSEPAMLRVISDNPRHSTYEVPADSVRIYGRVRWRAQRL